MPFSSGAIHVAQPLVDLCQAYKPDEDDYLRSWFFPRKPVQHDTDKVWKVNKADTLRLYDLDVSDNSEVPRVGYRTNGTYTYSCQPFAAAAELSPQEMKNADAALKHEMRQTKQALISMGVRMEKLAITQLRDTAVMTAYETIAGATRWDDFASASSDPIGDLQAAIEQVRTNVGKTSNKVGGKGGGRIHIGMSNFVGMILRQHPNVLNRLAFVPNGAGAILTPKILAEILGVNEEDVHVSSNHYTSSQQGETAAYKQFIGSDVVIGYVDGSDPDNDYGLGHEFIFDGLDGDNGFLVRKWREENRGYAGIDVVGVAAVVDYKLVNASQAGFLFKTVIDPTNTAAYGTWLD